MEETKQECAEEQEVVNCENRDTKDETYVSDGMCYGMAFGTLVGAVFGAIFGGIGT